MIPDPGELAKLVVCRFDGVASEQGGEGIDAAFEFLNPSLDAVSDAVGADDMGDA